jgi:hypothetical protein
MTIVAHIAHRHDDQRVQRRKVREVKKSAPAFVMQPLAAPVKPEYDWQPPLGTSSAQPETINSRWKSAVSIVDRDNVGLIGLEHASARPLSSPARVKSASDKPSFVIITSPRRCEPRRDLALPTIHPLLARSHDGPRAYRECLDGVLS